MGGELFYSWAMTSIGGLLCMYIYIYIEHELRVSDYSVENVTGKD